ncbi:MAG: cation:proton antiporter [Ilumatobacteraceae bacterium]
MLAATEGVDIARLLLDLLIVLAAARLAAEMSEKVRIPAVLGEIAAGIIIGPSVLELIDLTGDRGVSIGVLAEIGVLLLLLQVGMEMDVAELGKVGRASMLVAVVGIALPFLGGAVTGVAFGEEVKTAIFLGSALTATSVGITARVFGDLRALATTEARIVLGAAVADDVIGLVILTVVVKVVSGDSVGLGTVAGTLGLAVAFLLATGIVGLLLVPRLLDIIHRRASSGATIVIAALVLTLGFAKLADTAKLAFIIGAFMAGLSLGRSDHHERVSRDLGAIGNVLIPVFFVQIGMNADIGAMTKPSVLSLAAVLTGVGVAGKIASAVGAFGTRTDKLLIGLGMIPRGEVGLIFASIGLSNGVLDKDLYGALLVMVLVTTMATPPLLRLRIGRNVSTRATDATNLIAEPADGWLAVVGDRVHLRDVPPISSTVAIALRTAELLDRANPGDDLLDWFGRNRDVPLVFDPDDTSALIAVLRSHDSRAWRFLEVTGVLERALPEVASSLARRRADIRDLDPLGALRFPVLERLREVAPDSFGGDDDLVLAALAADVCDESSTDMQCAVDLLVRLGRVADADRLASIVADAHLLRSGAGDTHVFDELEILQLATHLASPIQARRAYALAAAYGELPRWRQEALDERYALVQEALDHPAITGGGATNLAAARMHAAQRLAASPAIIERLNHAAASYLLSHDPVELARQAQLVEPLPRAGIVRVAVSPDPEIDHWKIDVACRDTSGLLSRLSNVLAEAGLDVVAADIATWPDGAVLDTFTVRSRTRPSPRLLALAMQVQLRKQLTLHTMHDLALEFQNDSMPWHTVCIVRGPDQLGALQAVSAAFAAAGLIVHTARIASSDGQIRDRFAISDRLGRKIDAAAMGRVRSKLEGHEPRRWRIRRLSDA